MLPLWLDLVSRKAVVFGGGPVGRRKAIYLAQEAEVIVVSDTFDGDLPSSVRTVQGKAEDHLVSMVEWADLVVAATNDPNLNESIAREAERRGKWCNRADGISTFLIPSVVERERYKVAVSTEGRSPGMSRYLRKVLDEQLDRRFDLMIALQEELREAAKEAVQSQKEREQRLWQVLDDERVWDLLEKDPQEARRLAHGIVVR